MRFGKQRATLVLLFCLLPITTAFAFLQTPYVSDLVLQFSLRMLRFKTGIKIDARTWSVRPLTFSAALEGVSLQIETLQAEIPEFRVQLSPLSLITGNIQIRRVQLSAPRLSGSLAPRWLRTDKNAKDDTWVNKDIPKFLGESLAQVVEDARKKSVGFEMVALSDLKSTIDGYAIDDGEIEVENLEGGQAKLEWYLKGVTLPGKVATVRSTMGNLALIKGANREFFMVLSLFQFEPETHTRNFVEVNGRWPGDLRATAEINLEEFVAWYRASPALGDLGLKEGKGLLNFEGNVGMSRTKVERINGELKGNDLQLDNYLIKSLELKAKGNLENISIEKLRVGVDTGPGDSREWRNLISAENIKIESNRLVGVVDFSEVGLCSVLKATDVKGCDVSFPFSGPAQVEGTLSPFLLKVNPKFQINGLFVNTEDLKSRDDRSDELAATLPFVLTGDIELTPKAVNIGRGILDWGEGDKLSLEGRVDYNPSVVDLLVEGRNTKLQKMFQRFLALEPLGNANISAKIFYSENVPVEVGQTRILGRVTIEDFGVEGQNFGTITGPINYASRTLRIGPMRLTNGGGKATVDGTLVSTAKGSYFNIGAVMDRIELTGVTPESKSEVFRGFVTGTATLRGYTDSKSPEALAGPLDFKLDTFKIFGVPFQKGSIKARYANRILELQQVVGTKEKSTLRLKGVLNPDGGSELLFSTDDFRVKDLALNQSLEILQSGQLRIDGFWRPSNGWGLDGKISQVKIAGVELPAGPVKMGGNDKTFSAQAKLGDLIDFEYQADSKGNASYPAKLRATLKDRGLYGAFAYLKGWGSSVPVSTNGTLMVDWTPSRGFIRMNDLEIQGPQGQDGQVVPLLSAKGEHELAWNGTQLTKNTLSLDGPLKIQISPGSGSLSFKSDLPLAFLDLIIPNLRFIEGRATLNGEMPMPPDVATLRAQGALQRGTLFIRGVGQPIQNTNAQIAINRQQLSIAGGRGDLGGGEVTLDGVYKIDLNKPGANLQIGLKRAHVVVMDDVPADVTGDLVLKGEEPPYLFSGRVQVSNVLYSKEFKSEPLIIPPNMEAILRFGLDVELGSGVQVKNSLASILATGRLLVRGTDLEPDVAGKVTLVSGSLYANETEFKLIQGAVDFPGGVQPVIPNIQANTVIKTNSQEYKIDLRVRGTSLNPILELSSEPYLANVDILNLLLYGSVRSTEATLSSDVSGVAVEAIQMLFNKAIGRTLEKNTGVKLRFQSAQTSSEKYVPRVTFVKKLSDRMSLTYGRNLESTLQGNSGQLDYKLLNNVNLSGIVEEGETKQENSVGVDLRFRFEVK